MTNILQVFCKNSKLSGDGAKSALQKGPALSKICRMLCHRLLFKEVVDAGDMVELIFPPQFAIPRQVYAATENSQLKRKFHSQWCYTFAR